MAQGFTVWISGLPGCGKSGIAAKLEEILLERGVDAERLDEGEIRQNWLPSLGFGRAEQDGLTRLLGHVCHLLTRNGAVAVAAALSPSREVRNELRSLIGRFVEVHVKCPVEICRQRDRSGKYEQAFQGSLTDFVGVDLPYEEPLHPEIVLEPGEEDPDAGTRKIVRTLELLEWIPRVAGSDYDAADEEKITKRLKDLGYL